MRDIKPADQTAQYHHCLIMGGGGFRFGYYLGMYAALADAGKKPDLVLATCGGAIAAGIIKSFPDDAARKNWLCSENLYEFWRAHRVNPHATVTRALGGVIKRWTLGAGVRSIPDLHQDYQFDIPADMPLPPAGTPPAQGLDVAIVAGRLLYAKDETGAPRGQRHLFEQTVFANERVARLLERMPAPASSPERGAATVSKTLGVKTDMPLAHAVRASVSDMYLFRCHEHQGAHYTGGIIDLQPVELAQSLANHVTLECKSPYNRLIEQPAMRSVFGADGNRRLRSIQQIPNLTWIDTSDMEAELPSTPVTRRIHWHRNRIGLETPLTHREYVLLMRRQWKYGYERAHSRLRHAEEKILLHPATEP